MKRTKASLFLVAVAFSLSHASASTAQTFTSLPNTMNSAREYHAATRLRSGKILIHGGVSDTAAGPVYLNTAELYDPAARTFTALAAAMTSARAAHTATLLPDNTVLITGGPDTTRRGIAFDTAELYDPIAGTFAVLTARMTSPRGLHTATLLADGTVLITGGDDGSSRLNTAELYDPAARTFTAITATMSHARQGHTATLLPNGQVLIAGGAGSPGSMILDTAELYDPIAKTFTALNTRMKTARTQHTATLLPSGKVLITGGRMTNVLKTAELYDPATQTFAALAATMSSARQSHAATLLPDSTVLITGGDDGSTRLNSAELYHP